MTFTWPLQPAVQGIQDPEDWPELDSATVERFNYWLRSETQEEIARRVAQGHVDADSTTWWLSYLESAARMELVRYARKYRGEWVSVDMVGFCGGMKLCEIQKPK